ncbi:nitrate/nitrite transporter [Pelosinus sp. sgz500959]|uniref:MFS transporter n=1 Tax=Pelosinus sp. sgz500959 TaxID=3242472 RepID=UPI00366F178C
MATFALALSFAIWSLISSQSTRFQEELGLSDTQTGIMIAIPVLLGSIFRIPMGLLTEKYGGRLIFFLLMVFSIIPVLGLSTANSFEAVLAWGFLLGIAGTSFAVGIPFVSKWFPPEKQGLVLGIYGMGNIGTAVANFTVPLLNMSVGSQETLYLYAIVTLLFAILYYIAVRDVKTDGAPPTLQDSFHLIKTTSAVWTLSIFYFLTFGSFVAMGNYLPKLLVDLFHITKVDAGLKTAGFVVLATLCRPIGGYLADKLGGHRILNWVFIIFIAASLILAVTSTFYPVTIASLTMAVAAGLGNGAVFKLVPFYYQKQTGIVTGIAGAFGGIGGFFPPLLLGTIRQSTGNYFWGFTLLALFAVFCWWTNHKVSLACSNP